MKFFIVTWLVVGQVEQEVGVSEANRSYALKQILDELVNQGWDVVSISVREGTKTI
ncbi:hypothetical protein GD1_201 [Paraglaciecola Antarctic GD virus 1]|nr:hypothetical protein GD1_201 [Paraglaciecola Antarctic GD virus 1]